MATSEYLRGHATRRQLPEPRISGRVGGWGIGILANAATPWCGILWWHVRCGRDWLAVDSVWRPTLKGGGGVARERLPVSQIPAKIPRLSAGANHARMAGLQRLGAFVGGRWPVAQLSQGNGE